jgi:hypothetical protein
MKKQLIIGVMCACFVSAADLSFAAPSPNASSNATEKKANAGQGKLNAGQRSPKAGEKNNNAGGGGNPKVEIAHCGCNYDGSGLAWKLIKVSTRAKGHLKHTAGSSATCIYLDEEVSYVRAADDCRTSEEASNNIGGLESCDTVPAIDENCTAEEQAVVDDEDGEV